MICAPLPCLLCIATETAPKPTQAWSPPKRDTCCVSVANCGQPRIGTRRRNKPPPPPSSRFSALFSLASSRSGISRDAESEIESWRIELRLARNQRQLFALASLSRLIARHTRSRFASWPRPRFDALECNFYFHHKLRKKSGLLR